MNKKEPDFMVELHRIRAKLSKKWLKMKPQEFRETMHQSSKWFKTQLVSIKEEVKVK